ncbi:MAG: hypothetical protein ABIR15_07675 [Chitinophagaceae bacterium]
MASIGKKILSAFVELTDATPAVKKPGEVNSTSTFTAVSYTPKQADNEKFRKYFEKLFEEANMPGPDYYEFSKMIEAMKSIPDENARFSAAFAGLQVQGLDKQKLLATASSYLEIMDKDAVSFFSTVDAAMQEKVLGKKNEMEEKTQRVKDLSNEISDLQHQVAVLNNEIKDNEEKLAHRTDSYKDAMENMKSRIQNDAEKIKSFIQ